MEATVEAVVEVEKGAATKLRGDDAIGATGANASVEVANRQIAERIATILFMVIVVLREDDTLVGRKSYGLGYYDNDIDLDIGAWSLQACTVIIVDRRHGWKGFEKYVAELPAISHHLSSRHFAPLFISFDGRFDDRRSIVVPFGHWPCMATTNKSFIEKRHFISIMEERQYL